MVSEKLEKEKKIKTFISFNIDYVLVNHLAQELQNFTKKPK